MTWGNARTGRWIILSCALALMVSCESSRTAFARLTGQLVIGGDAVLAEAQPQQAYRAALVVTGGEAPYRWSLRDGWLPSGLSLQPDGTVRGTPEVPGEFYFTAQVADAEGHSASRQFELRVPSRGLAIVTSSSDLPWATAGVDYLVRLTAWGGAAPYAWKAVTPLPTGLKLDDDGMMEGAPVQGGDYQFTIQVTGLQQQSVRRDFRLHVSPVQVDHFGGVMAVRSPRGADGHWRTEKIGDRWVLITPEGHAFWMLAVWGVTGDSHVDERGIKYDDWTKQKYGSLAATFLQANRRLRSWGFNSIGPWSYRMAHPYDAEPEWGGVQPVKFPYTTRAAGSVEKGRDHGIFKSLFARVDSSVLKEISSAAAFPDVFDPAWVAETRRQYAHDEDLQAKSRSPYFIGSFADDTDDLGGFGGGPDFVTDPPGKMHVHLAYLALVAAPTQETNPYSKPAEQRYADTQLHTKFALRDFLRQRYGTIEALNAAWGASYTTFDSDGGWPKGNGLLDENGRRSHSWLGSGDPELPKDSGANPRMVADLDEFLYRIARQYLSVHRDALKSIAPHALFFGPTNIGGWGAPARAPIYRAAGELQDVISVSTDCSQAQLDFITRAAGDVPLVIWEGMLANPDSSRWRHRDPDVAEASWYLPTQQARAEHYRQRANLIFNGRSSVTGNKHYVGLLWWWWIDMISEQKNWGLVTLMDNAYDGMEATRGYGIDAWGYRTGGEEKNYGDFLHPAREMNFSIVERLAAGK